MSSDDIKEQNPEEAEKSKVTFAESENHFKLENERENKNQNGSNKSDNKSENGGIHLYLEKLSSGFKDSASQIAEKTTFIYMIIPPDKGYSWCIMVMTFFGSCILDGTIYVISDILGDIEIDFGLTKKETSLISAFHLGTYFCLGPFSSAFINKFGFRTVACAGCLISISGVVIGSFMPNFTALLLTYGSLLGAGGGMAYTSGTLINSYYFEKYRPITTGFVGSGFGMAILIFAPVNKVLVAKYGWRTTLRIHAGLIGIVLCLSCFYRPVRPTQIGEVMIKDQERLSESSSTEEYETKSFTQSERLSISKSMIELPKLESKSKLIRLYEAFERCLYKCCKCGKLGTKISSIADGRFVIEMGPLDRKDIFYSGKLDRQYSNIETSISTVEKMLTAKDASVIEKIAYQFSSYRVLEPGKKPKKSRILVSLQYLFHLELLKTAEFNILLLTAFVLNMGAFIPLAYAKNKSSLSPTDAEILLPVIGITTLICRIFSGILAYKFTFNVMYFCGLGLLFSSTILFITPCVSNNINWFQYFYVCAFTAGTSSYQALRAILYCNVLGLEKLTNAFGLGSLAYGLGSFCGISIAGSLIAKYDGYSEAYFFAATVTLTASALTLSLPMVPKIRRLLHRKGRKSAK